MNRLILAAVLGGVVGYATYRLTGSVVIEIIVCLILGFIIGFWPKRY
jgi:F0F1-type ATP synthase assembly protein I